MTLHNTRRKAYMAAALPLSCTEHKAQDTRIHKADGTTVKLSRNEMKSITYEDITQYKNTTRDRHQLPSSWKSDIYLVNPGLSSRLIYVNKRIAEVYDHVDFDGFQIDQLGIQRYAAHYTGE